MENHKLTEELIDLINKLEQLELHPNTNIESFHLGILTALKLVLNKLKTLD